MSHIMFCWRFHLLVLASMVLATSSIAFANESSDDVRELKELEARVQNACQAVMRAVVSVDGASGVIITPEGVVLSQYHVSHHRPNEPFENSFEPGHELPVVFADGKESTAKVLGADQGHDISLVQLVGKGPFPFVPLDFRNAARLGDWVIKMGHPAGYQPGRRPVVRLGKVVSRLETERLSIFNTDCSINGGDSGGPYFDLDGKLVGVIEGSARPSGLKVPSAMTLRTKSLWAATTSERIDGLMASMRRREISPTFDREWPAMYQGASLSSSEDWTQGRKNVAKWKDVVATLQDSVVKIYDGNYQIALGTVVDLGGVVVTKASVLPRQFTCVLADGSEVTAKVLGMDAAFDVAVLQLDSAPKPITWCDRQKQPVGTFLAALGHADLPLGVGVISVQRRNQKGPFPEDVLHIPRRSASTPAIAGFPVDNHGLVVVAADGNAADAGLLPGDELISLASSRIQSEADLASAVQGLQAGDTVQVSVIREGRVVSLDMKLDNREAAKHIKRRSRFPTVFEHDAPVLANELGGPAVNLDSEAIGVSIARVSGYGCAAIPSEIIKRIVSEHAP